LKNVGGTQIDLERKGGHLCPGPFRSSPALQSSHCRPAPPRSVCAFVLRESVVRVVYLISSVPWCVCVHVLGMVHVGARLHCEVAKNDSAGFRKPTQQEMAHRNTVSRTVCTLVLPPSSDRFLSTSSKSSSFSTVDFSELMLSSLRTRSPLFFPCLPPAVISPGATLASCNPLQYKPKSK
jgi:hypothetical protein